MKKTVDGNPGDSDAHLAYPCVERKCHCFGKKRGPKWPQDPEGIVSIFPLDRRNKIKATSDGDRRL